jgi:hypothetical protein
MCRSRNNPERKHRRKGGTIVGFRYKFRVVVLAFMIFGWLSQAVAQQKPQWMPGQMGLNAGILPWPGFTYVNMEINYDAGTFNGPKGNAVPATGTYNVWAVENIFYYLSDTKFLGGNIGFMVMFPTPATGSVVADINVQGLPNLSGAGGAGVGGMEKFKIPDSDGTPFQLSVSYHDYRWNPSTYDYKLAVAEYNLQTLRAESHYFSQETNDSFG